MRVVCRSVALGRSGPTHTHVLRAQAIAHNRNSSDHSMCFSLFKLICVKRDEPASAGADAGAGAGSRRPLGPCADAALRCNHEHHMARRRVVRAPSASPSPSPSPSALLSATGSVPDLKSSGSSEEKGVAVVPTSPSAAAQSGGGALQPAVSLASNQPSLPVEHSLCAFCAQPTAACVESIGLSAYVPFHIWSRITKSAQPPPAPQPLRPSEAMVAQAEALDGVNVVMNPGSGAGSPELIAGINSTPADVQLLFRLGFRIAEVVGYTGSEFACGMKVVYVDSRSGRTVERVYGKESARAERLTLSDTRLMCVNAVGARAGAILDQFSLFPCAVDGKTQVWCLCGAL